MHRFEGHHFASLFAPYLLVGENSEDPVEIVPSDTKLLLTNNFSKIIIFEKITNLTRNSLKCLSLLDIFRIQNTSKITRNNSQGIIFVIISCQK